MYTDGTGSGKSRTDRLARTRKEVKDGIQTIQYQINTLMTTNGQAPFVTLSCISCRAMNMKKKRRMIVKKIEKKAAGRREKRTGRLHHAGIPEIGICPG